MKELPIVATAKITDYLSVYWGVLGWERETSFHTFPLRNGWKLACYFSWDFVHSCKGCYQDLLLLDHLRLGKLENYLTPSANVCLLKRVGPVILACNEYSFVVSIKITLIWNMHLSLCISHISYLIAMFVIYVMNTTEAKNSSKSTCMLCCT